MCDDWAKSSLNGFGFVGLRCWTPISVATETSESLEAGLLLDGGCDDGHTNKLKD